MTQLDELFASGYAEQARVAEGADLEAVLGHVVAGAAKRRRTRALVNGGLTVLASAVLAGAAWASLHTPAEPAGDPEPSPTLAQALPAPSLEPVWDGGLVPLEQAVPAAFTDDFSTANLTAAESPGANFPQAYEMADWVWDQVGTGWSLQTWQADGQGSPTYLYLASPGGTYFLVREFDAFAGDESWEVESWSARPAVAVLSGQDGDQLVAARRLIDLRTGETIRAWGAAGGDKLAFDNTVLASGFADGRSVRVDFTAKTGYWEDSEPATPTDARILIVNPDGTTREVTGDGWSGSTPSINGRGGDGHTALVTDTDGHVLVIDLDKGSAHAVALALPGDKTCDAPALTAKGDIAAYCYAPDDLTTFVTTFDAATGALIDYEQLSGSPLESQGFRWEPGGQVTDIVTGKAVDLSRTPALAQYFTVIPMAPGQFAFVDAATTSGTQLVLYDRPSGSTFTVLSDTVPGSRAQAAVRSVAPLLEVVPNETGLILGGSN